MKRFATLEVHHDPAQVWVLLFAVLILVRAAHRRSSSRGAGMWVKADRERRRLAAPSSTRAWPAVRTPTSWRR
ncbi:hypothetical protein ACRAWC_24630 [Leifsonia sp. L25]|uniref:hypothetical protein n=1 Tax=Leifsonia sp. L25 TaxID=3423957 RepID=UPI003D695374